MVSDCKHCLLVNFIDMGFSHDAIQVLSTVQHAGDSGGGGRGAFSEIGVVPRSKYQITRGTKL